MASDYPLTDYSAMTTQNSQLDLFSDNEASYVERDIVDAILTAQISGENWAKVHQLILDYRHRFELETAANTFEQLILLACEVQSAKSMSQEDAQTKLKYWETTLQQATCKIFADQGDCYQKQLFRHWLSRLHGQPFDSRYPLAHKSHILLNLKQYSSVVQCIQDEPGYDTQPVLIHRLAAALQHQGPVLSANFWSAYGLSFMSFDARQITEIRLRFKSYWQTFEEAELDDASFIYWLMLMNPLFIEESEKWQISRLDLTLLKVIKQLSENEKNTHIDTKARKALQLDHPDLFKAYLQNRHLLTSL